MLRKTLDFMLYDWLDVESLTSRDRFADHSRETFDSVLDSCERIASERFAPFNRAVDVEEPRLENDVVVQPSCAKAAADAYVESGLLAAAQDHEFGGMQLPCVVAMAANSMFAKASIGLHGGSVLTAGNANLLLAHGNDAQRQVFAANELSGRWFGTMCLSEPNAGSGLGDITTRAVPADADFESDPLGPRYRLFGNKMWISNGDHELSENIVHLVLAKIPDADGRLVPGVRGISLFVVPKWMVDIDGRLTAERNDISVAGLNHKLGHRGIPNALLNFGEGRRPVRGAAGAIGYRVGAPGEGLKCMFHMMNEARIAIGLCASSIGYAGFEASLDYARNRRQGRPLRAGGKDATAAPVPIIEHADVRRMLLAQKAYAEGGLALSLYCARLVDEARTGSAAEVRAAKLLLDVLTPVAKSWASEWCVEANSLAIQVHGGYGYTREYLVELLWRDNRLNMIHEGTHGIQGLDLLGRKVRVDGGAAFDLLEARVRRTSSMASRLPAFADLAELLDAAFDRLRRATVGAWQSGDAELATANATPYLQGFGHVVIAWIWLDMALAAANGACGDVYANGKTRAARYFFDYELPRVDAWLQAAERQVRTCLDMRDEWFES